MEDDNNSECFTEFNENLEEVVKSTLIPLRNLKIGITDDHIQQYRQIQRWNLSRSGWQPDRKDKRKYKLTIERRLDKKHFDAVFRRVGTSRPININKKRIFKVVFPKSLRLRLFYRD